MPEGIEYILKRPNVPAFIRTARRLHYQVDSITVRGLEDREYFPLCRKVDKFYRKDLEAVFGVPLHNDNVERGSGHILQIQGYPVSHYAANFKNLKSLHERKMIHNFALRRFVVVEESRFSKGIGKVGTKIDGISFASDDAAADLYNPSRPQNYQVIMKETFGPPQLELLNLLDKRPEIVPIALPSKN